MIEINNESLDARLKRERKNKFAPDLKEKRDLIYGIYENISRVLRRLHKACMENDQKTKSFIPWIYRVLEMDFETLNLNDLKIKDQEVQEYCKKISKIAKLIKDINKSVDPLVSTYAKWKEYYKKDIQQIIEFNKESIYEEIKLVREGWMNMKEEDFVNFEKNTKNGIEEMRPYFSDLQKKITKLVEWAIDLYNIRNNDIFTDYRTEIEQIHRDIIKLNESGSKASIVEAILNKNDAYIRDAELDVDIKTKAIQDLEDRIKAHIIPNLSEKIHALNLKLDNLIEMRIWLNEDQREEAIELRDDAIILSENIKNINPKTGLEKIQKWADRIYDIEQATERIEQATERIENGLRHPSFTDVFFALVEVIEIFLGPLVDLFEEFIEVVMAPIFGDQEDGIRNV